MNNRVYLVTGASGFLGSHICDELLEQGERVRALVMKGDRAMKYVPPAVEVVEGNLCEKESLESFFEIEDGCESVVIHCASMVTTNAEFNQKLIDINVGGTQNMIDVCLNHPECKKMVYVSSTGAIPELPKGMPIMETDRFTPIDEKTQVGCYSQSKAMATQAVLDACRERGLKACVVHPSGILGPKDYAIGETTGTVIKIMNGKMPVAMGGSFNLCDVRDLAHGCIAAVDKGRVGECYILGNKEVTLKEVCQILHRVSGCKQPLFYVPISMAYRLADQMEKKAAKTGEKPMMTNFAVYNLDRNNQFDYSKAERELGYHTRSYEETLRDEAAWLVEGGYIEGNVKVDGPSMIDHAMEGMGYVQKVAQASSVQELQRYLFRGGFPDASQEQLEQAFSVISLSQNWEEVESIIKEEDYREFKKKLAEHDEVAEPAEFDLIRDIVKQAQDQPMLAKMQYVSNQSEAADVLADAGYYHITEQFLGNLLDNYVTLRDQKLLDESSDLLQEKDFWESCRKSVNIIFTLGSLAQLRYGTERAFKLSDYIVIAGGMGIIDSRYHTP